MHALQKTGFRRTLEECRADHEKAVHIRKKLLEEEAKREAFEAREKERQAKKEADDKVNMAARLQRDKEKKEYLAQAHAQAEEARQKEQA